MSYLEETLAKAARIFGEASVKCFSATGAARLKIPGLSPSKPWVGFVKEGGRYCAGATAQEAIDGALVAAGVEELPG